MCRVMRGRRRGVIEAAITSLPDRVTDDEHAALKLLVDESRRPVTYLAVFARQGRPGAHEALLERMADLLGRDRAVPQVSCRPLRVQFTLKNPFIFATMAAWGPAFNRTLDEQRALYASAAFRDGWKEEMDRRRIFRGQWARITVRDGGAASAPLIGRSIADLASSRQAAPSDVLLDVALADGLETLFDFPVLNQDPEGVRPLVTDPRVLIGLSDGGAHVDQLCDAGYATYLLGKWARERQALSLPAAVRRLTSEVADFFGIRDRGRIAPGQAADLVLLRPGHRRRRGAGVRAGPARRRQAARVARRRRARDPGGRTGRIRERAAYRGVAGHRAQERPRDDVTSRWRPPKETTDR